MHHSKDIPPDLLHCIFELLYCVHPVVNMKRKNKVTEGYTKETKSLFYVKNQHFVKNKDLLSCDDYLYKQ